MSIRWSVFDSQCDLPSYSKTSDFTYIGLISNTFKIRYNSHTCSFRNESKKSETTLSQYIWKLKNLNVTFDLSWKIIETCPSYSPSSKTCKLCLSEKYYIIYHSHMATLNSRNELNSTCRHKRKFLLCNS